MFDDEIAATHETAFVRSFVVPEKRDRYLAKLKRQKTRSQFLEGLNHMLEHDLDNRFVCDSPSVDVPSGDHPCYMLADEKEMDARFIPASAVADTLSNTFFGVVVSCVPGKLAAYKAEAPADVIWLERTT